MKKSFTAKNCFGLLLAIGVMLTLCLGVSCYSAVFENDLSENSAYADTPTAPEISGITLFPYSVKSGNINKLNLYDAVFDLTGTSWYSNAGSANSSSLISALAIKITYAPYNYTSINKYYQSSSITGSPANTTQEPVENNIPIKIANLIDISDFDSLTVNKIYVSGKTWYGKTVSNYDLLANTKNVVAGEYHVTRINITYSYSIQYLTEQIQYFVNATQQSSGTKVESATEKKMATKTFSDTQDVVLDNSLAYQEDDDYPEQIPVLLTTKVNVGTGIESLIEDNLGIDACYAGESLIWFNNILLYGNLASSESPANCFYYSFNDGLRKPFVMQYGYSALTNKDSGNNGVFDMTEVLDIGIASYSKLKIKWYTEKNCNSINEINLSELTYVKAGDYYAKIEIADDELNSYVSSIGDKISLVTFMYGSKEYVQTFTVKKAVINIDFDNGPGMAIVNTALPYVDKYSLAYIPSEYFGQPIPVGQYYELMSDNTYKAIDSGNVFDSLKTYYVNYASATSLFDVTTYDGTNKGLTQEIWINQLGGAARDWATFEEKQSISKYWLEFRGSHFDSYQIGSYSYVYLYLYIAYSEIAENYTLDLGCYVDSTWMSYRDNSLESGKNCLVEGNLHERGGIGDLFIYKIYGNYKITEPAVNIEMDRFIEIDENDKADNIINYGAKYNNAEIDYSKVSLANSVIKDTNDSSLYQVVTSESDWKIKIINNISSVVKDANANMIYVLMRVCTKNTLNPMANDYIASDGVRYTPYDGVLYSGEYFVAFSVYVWLKGVSSFNVAQCDNGYYSVLNASGVSLTKIGISAIVSYTVVPVEILMNVTDYVADKYYDGNDNVKSSAGGKAIGELGLKESYEFSTLLRNQNYSNILEYDMANNIDYSYAITYSNSMANEALIDINGIFSLNAIDGYSGSADTLNSIINSYITLNGLYINNEAQSLKGHIDYLFLDLKILENPDRITDISDPNYSEADYSRNYGQDTYVAVRVAKNTDTNSEGETLRTTYPNAAIYASQMGITINAFWQKYAYYADYYYYYDNYSSSGSYYYYSDLPEIHNGRCYIFLEVDVPTENNHGFLSQQSDNVPAQGFDWDRTKFYTNLEIFYYDAAQGSLLNFITSELILWNDIVSNTEINSSTKASTYNITIDVDNYKITNYKIALSTNSESSFSLEVMKLSLDPDFVFDFLLEDSSVGRYLNYNATSNLDKVFTSNDETTFIKFSNHDEYNVLNERENGQFKSYLTIVGFTIDYYSGDMLSHNKKYDVSEFNNEIYQMIWAGTYTLKVTIPETTNYKPVTSETTIVIHTATVKVYTTVAVRTYMADYNSEDEVKLGSTDSALKKTNEQAEQRKMYIDSTTGELYETNVTGAYREVYVYFNNDNPADGYNTDNIHIYYVGFVGEDWFSTANNDVAAEINIDLPFEMINGKYQDKAGEYSDRITCQGAFKLNYSFTYSLDALFVIKQQLVLAIEPNQKVSYNGNNLAPDYDVFNSNNDLVAGKLSMYIAAYYALNGSVYELYVKDFSAQTPFLRQATIASNYNVLNDYYYYFYDGDKAINIYYDSTRSKYFYYPDNDNLQDAIDVRDIILNLKNTDGNDKFVAYVDLINDLGDDGKIYLAINEDVKASEDTKVSDVFYSNDLQGGYILKVAATPDEGAGASSSNYSRSETELVIFEIDLLSISLKQNNSENIDGTIINPIAISTYTSLDFSLDELKEYYEGITISGETVVPSYFWGNVSFAVLNDGTKRFYYNLSTDASFSENYGAAFAAYENDYNATQFSPASSTTLINDAGLYVILLKVDISDGTMYEGHDTDMRKNIRFVSTSSQSKFAGSIQTSESDYSAYFVLYLVMERSSDIKLTVKTSDNVKGIDLDEDSIVDAYEKEYDGTLISFGENLIVLNKTSSSGEVLNVRAYLSTTESYLDGELYFKSVIKYNLATVTVGSDIPRNTYYIRRGNGQYVLTSDVKFLGGTNYYTRIYGIQEYDLTQSKLINLINANVFNIIYFVNFDDGSEMNYVNSTYNNNFQTIQHIYRIDILPRQLNVFIKIIDGEESYKSFGQENSEVEYKFYFEYQNWATATNDQAELSGDEDIGSPVIDWSAVSTEIDPTGKSMSAAIYTIYAMNNPDGVSTYPPVSKVLIDGEDFYFNNYYFNYANAHTSFEIKPLKLVVGDGSQYPCAVISDSAEYNGEVQKPIITRYGYDGSLLNVPNGVDNVVSDITPLGIIPNYNPQHNYSQEELEQIIPRKRSVVDVGYYLFKITMPDSTNYIGIGTIFWVFRITKSILTVNFVDVNNGYQVSRGAESVTYSGTDIIYPEYTVKYSGFKGDDALLNVLSNGESGLLQRIPYLHSGKENVALSPLGLINPYYVFINEETGEEIKDTAGRPVMPIASGVYYIKIVIDLDNYGFASNYDLEVAYEEDGNDVLYPTFTITKRQVSVEYDATVNAKIVKTYDGTDRVIENSVTPDNYTFTKVDDNIKTGLIAGDFININVNYIASKYARSTVCDELGERSDIDVYLLVEGTLLGDDADNYQLVLLPTNPNTHVIDGVTYLKLNGTINPASAVVRYYNSDGQVVTTSISVKYDSEPQDVTVIVSGVNGEILTLENGDYTINYKSELSNYDRDIAPSNCDTYKVTIAICNTNYAFTTNSIYLIIGQAEVEILFGGEGIQIYGDVTTGLTAMAIGVGNYQKTLEVSYYYYNANGTLGDPVADISEAPIGTYGVVATHNSTTNYAYALATETFSIVPRTVLLNYDVAGYYKYTGSAVKISMYFIDNSVKYYPTLMFDKLVDDVMTPYNYVLDSEGKVVSVSENYPVNAGTYRVKAYEVFADYVISDAVWCDFVIQKADMVVSVSDLSIKQGEPINFTIILEGKLTDAPSNTILSGITYTYYKSNTNEKLSAEPTEPGTYKVICGGATSENYNLSYKFSVLTIKKTTVQTVANDAQNSQKSVEIVFEGAFDENTIINVTKKQNKDYSDIMTSFNSYKEQNVDYAAYNLSDIYVFEYVNYTVSKTDNAITIKIHMPDLLKTADRTVNGENALSIKLADNDKYYVAVLSVDGSLDVQEAYLSGEYLCFEARDVQVKAVSLLTTEQNSTNNSLDWILYLGIALAALLIVISIVIVVKRD